MHIEIDKGTLLRLRCLIFLGILTLKLCRIGYMRLISFFDIIDVPKEEQVKIVAYKLHGGAEAWWQNRQDKHRRQGKYLINIWQGMKIIIKCSF